MIVEVFFRNKCLYWFQYFTNSFFNWTVAANLSGLKKRITFWNCVYFSNKESKSLVIIHMQSRTKGLLIFFPMKHHSIQLVYFFIKKKIDWQCRKKYFKFSLVLLTLTLNRSQKKDDKYKVFFLKLKLIYLPKIAT